MTATETTTTVVVPGTHLMAALLGPRDQHLRQIEDAFPSTEISVRGNEVTVRGERRRARSAGCSRSSSSCSSRASSSTSASLRRVDRHGRRRRAAERGAHPRRAARRQGPPRSGRRRPARSATSTPSRDNVITFGIGPAGTGKSWLAVAMAVQALQAKQVQRIILTRPAVEAGERLGFLPGDLMAKIDPYLRPLYDALYDMVEPEGAQRLLERQTVEVAPLAFMRGRTLNNSFIILDEAQNTTPEQMKMFLTRIGFGSQGRRHRRHHPGRRARRHERPARPRAGAAAASTGWPSCTSAPPTSCATASSPTSSPPTSATTATGGPVRDTRLSLRAAESHRRRRRDQVVVVGADEQADVDVDLDRWAALADAVLRAEGVRGELTLTFVDRDEIAALNAEHLGKAGPTDVLSFPLDAARRRQRSARRRRSRCCSATSWSARRSPRAQAPDARRHARRRAGPARRARRAPRARPRPRRAGRDAPRCGRRELELLDAHHWHGPAPAGFRQEHRTDR